LINELLTIHDAFLFRKKESEHVSPPILFYNPYIYGNEIDRLDALYSLN
jgi:hypothetical protein